MYLIESFIYVATGTYFIKAVATFDKRAGYTFGIMTVIWFFMFDNWGSDEFLRDTKPCFILSIDPLSFLL